MKAVYQVCPSSLVFSYFSILHNDVIFFYIPESTRSALSKEFDPGISIQIRIYITCHDVTPAVNKNFERTDIQKHSQFDGIFLSNAADSVVDIVFMAGEGDAGFAAVKYDLLFFCVVVDKSLMFTSAE